jgi:hypothetical protein
LDGTGRGNGRSSSVVLLLDDYLFALVVVLGTGKRVLVRVVVAVRVDGVLNAVGYLVCGVGDSLTKRMVLALVVVISHITLELLGGGSSGTSRFFYSDLGLIARVNTVNLSVVGVRVAYGGVGLLGIASTGDDGSGTFTELTLGDVELRGSGGGGRAVNSVEVSVVGWVLNLDF